MTPQITVAALAYARIEDELEAAQRALMPRGQRALIEARLERAAQELRCEARKQLQARRARLRARRGQVCPLANVRQSCRA